LADAAIPKSLVDAKGDIVTATADNTPARVAVGTNEHRLVADSAETTGLKYVADTTNYAVGAKGDLLAGTAADTVEALAVGNDGEQIVADSSTATGLRYNANFAAGKNAIINGDFRINQRNFTSETTNAYGFDRMRCIRVGGTVTYTAETFTPGTAPVAGYEAINFARVDTTGQSAAGDNSRLLQRIEDVRAFAGQTVTFSFWAKASSGTPQIAAGITQAFGSGGSAAVTIAGQKVTLSTSWTRFALTFSVPSISGKTVGTSSYLEPGFYFSAGSDLNTASGSLGTQAVTVDIWGVQLEAGSVATAFQTATGTLQGELAACQRYYWRSSDTNAFANYGVGYADQTNSLYASVKLPVSMRVKPTSVDYSTLCAHIYNVSATSLSVVTLESSSASRDWGVVVGSASGLTQYRPYGLNNNNSTSGYIGFSAEL
jgi:hypothetical protein